MDDLISSESAGEGLWRMHNAMGEVCYLVEGAREAILVDTMGGLAIWARSWRASSERSS